MNDLMYENYENYGVFSKANRDWCFHKNFFKMLGKHLFLYINQFENYRLCGIISGADILLSQGHTAKGRCVPGFLKLPLSGKSVHVSAPQWCRMARPIFKKGLVALSV